ncbi:acyclic terpene utilization AtuA family protein [uncultured Ferrovibrio sp.]|uniref:acyclic terpene utilization AtuA family protein n=1 Tax=uncultured Ferrovibrio sp. TaxID=1576913 RepID=UPI00261D35AA|nr:acyclic terpene utilization AtuA family protein [uncultured Ferrovibrio sp.]
MGTDSVLVGCGAGFSGDRLDAAAPVVRSLIRAKRPAAIMFETLGERTLALAQLARMENPDKGYEPLLERLLAPILEACLQHNIRILGNFGAANPLAAAKAIAGLGRRLGCRPMRIAVVQGDDLVAAGQLGALEDESGRPLAFGPVISANAYLGAAPLVEALQAGADIVVSGRVADPSLALAPFIHHHGWALDDWQRLACGTLAGHLLECGAQVTGGYYADPGFKDVPDPHDIGFPIVAMQGDGDFTIGKADTGGGLVDRHTVTEQILYEIHDPSRYLTPDVTLDITNVELDDSVQNEVRVRGAVGHARPERLKVTVGYDGGWLGEGEISYAGPNAAARAKLALDVIRRRIGPDISMRGDIIGVASVFNDDAGQWLSQHMAPSSDVRLRIAVSSPDRAIAARAAEEVLALYTCGPAGGGGARGNTRRRIATASAYIRRDLVKTRIEMLE